MSQCIVVFLFPFISFILTQTIMYNAPYTHHHVQCATYPSFSLAVTVIATGPRRLSLPILILKVDQVHDITTQRRDKDAATKHRRYEIEQRRLTLFRDRVRIRSCDESDRV